MKNVSSALLMSVVVFFGYSMAVASSMNTECSNASGSIKLKEGHYENQLEFTKTDWESGKKTTVIIDSAQVNVATLETKELFKKSNQSCDKKTKYGFHSFFGIEYRLVRIKNENGTRFPEGTPGVTMNRKIVEAHLICETDISSEMYCE